MKTKPVICFYHPGAAPIYAVVESVQVFSAVCDLQYIPDAPSIRIVSEDRSFDVPPTVLTPDTKELKRWIYRVLRELTGYESPWGCMTGIRPAKIVNTLTAEGLSEAEIRRHFRDFYYTAPEKADLAIETARVQAPFLRPQDGVVDFYANIPFCPSRCLYCSFTSNSIVKYKKVVDRYLDAMEEELKAAAKMVRAMGVRIGNLYLGGGTPTSLSETQFYRYMEMFRNHLDLETVQEFSLEAGRPDSITAAKLEAAKAAGVTRISINPQTMNDETLKRIGRNHTAEQVETAFYLAREKGFENINMDIIAGLPYETEAMFRYTLDCIARLGPEGMTVHTLSIKRAANLRDDWESREALNMSLAGKMVSAAGICAGKMGMRPFYMYRQKNMLGNHENVSYCKPGFESPYNIHIMEEDRTIIAVGAGAVTKAVFPDNRIERVFNVKSVEDYLARMPEMIERKRALLGVSL